VIRRLKAAGFIEVRRGKGSHRLFKHPDSGKEIWVAVHTKKDAGQLGHRILREAVIAPAVLALEHDRECLCSGAAAVRGGGHTRRRGTRHSAPLDSVSPRPSRCASGRASPRRERVRTEGSHCRCGRACGRHAKRRESASGAGEWPVGWSPPRARNIEADQSDPMTAACAPSLDASAINSVAKF
jgi:predicted RNA binding protein YcfA (HicA-like mRNA interferase family)